MPTIDTNGVIRRSPISDGEKSDILIALKQGKTAQEVARMFARDPQTINRIIKEFKPTKELAKARLEASLSTLVERVVAKADVDQAIDILSRPNIGVLEAPAKQGAGVGGPNIGVSVQIGSLAAVSNQGQFEQTEQKVIEGEVAGRSIQVGSVKVGQSSLSEV